MLYITNWIILQLKGFFEMCKYNASCFSIVYGEGRRPARSLSMRVTPRTTTPVTSTTLTRQQQEPYDLHDTLASMNDSSLYCHVSAQSPLTPTSTPTPAPTHVRNGSGDYQGQQTDRELKYFSSEDSGLVSIAFVSWTLRSLSGVQRPSFRCSHIIFSYFYLDAVIARDFDTQYFSRNDIRV